MKRFEKVQQMNAKEQAKFIFDNWVEFYVIDGSPICKLGCDSGLFRGNDNKCYQCVENWLNEEIND
jgi:hypothetical protein